jgi:hypothetical protein
MIHNDNFTSARKLIPEEEVDEIEERWKCGNTKRHGCRISKRNPMHQYCAYCTMLMSIGTDFFGAERDVKEDEALKANAWQLSEYGKLKPYWERWMDNFPKGTT